MSFNEANIVVRSKCFVQPRISFATVVSKAVAPKNVLDLEPCKSSISTGGTKPFSFNTTFSTKNGNSTLPKNVLGNRAHSPSALGRSSQGESKLKELKLIDRVGFVASTGWHTP